MAVFPGRRLPIASIFTAILFLLFTSSATSSIFPTRRLGGGMRKQQEYSSGPSVVPQDLLTRRRLSGPGSSPPSCRSKCGRCNSCYPVHVPVHPGLSIPLEYYPEAWRCKCGNKLYMP